MKSEGEEGGEGRSSLKDTWQTTISPKKTVQQQLFLPQMTKPQPACKLKTRMSI